MGTLKTYRTCQKKTVENNAYEKFLRSKTYPCDLEKHKFARKIKEWDMR
jgi:hypothetical protein